MPRPEPPERIRYRPGQLLAARDLVDDLRAARQGQWLHTLALHGTWGIALGLGVERLAHGRRVRVEPGLAYDHRGRELLLPEGVEIAIPAATLAAAPPGGGRSAVLDLVIRHAAEDLRGPRDTDAACPGDRRGLRGERPVVGWRRPDGVRLGLEVPVVRATLADGVVAGLDPGVRRHARPEGRPRVVAGRTPPGGTWNRWDLEWRTPETAGVRRLGWWIEVSTEDAGFTRAPQYFAGFAEDPFERVPGLASRVLGPFTAVEAPTPHGFRWTVVIVAPTPDADPADAHELFRAASPAVAWMGVEAEAPC